MKNRFVKIAAAIMCFICAAVFSSCSAESSGFEAMDTYMSLSLYSNNADEAIDRIKTEAYALDSLLSVTDNNSDISQINSSDVPVEVNDETAELLDEAMSLCEKLDGYLDITIYPVVRAWGFTAQEYRVPPREELDGLLSYVGIEKLRKTAENTFVTEKNTQIDLGSVAKGFLADKANDICDQLGVSSGIMNFGGTVCAKGSKNGSDWKVGIADPEAPSSYFGALSLRDKIIATSGGYERSFTDENGKTYIHIIDPVSGEPVSNGVVSVTVICDRGVTADALSTALFVMGKDKAERFYRENTDFEFDYIMLTDDDNLWISSRVWELFSLSEDCSFTLNRIDRN